MGNVRETIESGKAVLGIEFGSTRIKAVLIDEKHTPIAGGSHEWENRYENGVWTYSLDDIWGGLTDCYASLKADVKEKYGSIDILASNAGLNRPMPLDQVTPEVWDSVMNVNLRGAFFMAQAVAPVMKAQGKGRIIFTSSQAGLVARENQQPYCASKGGINAMTRALAYDLAPFGITVNAVAPCFAMTALTKARLEDPEYRDMVLGMIPVGRVVEPSEVGAAFNYLASDEAAMITGQTLVIDGGWTMW